MPKDKTASHIKVLAAAKQEFLEKGFEQATIRDIAGRTGMTSAALYRHCRDKEDLFCILVKPAIDDLNRWLKKHEDSQFQKMKDQAPKEVLFQESDADLIREVVLPHRDEFRLLIQGAGGTKYHDFIHELVKLQCSGFLRASVFRKETGAVPVDITEGEMKMLMTAYTTALFEPVLSDQTPEETEHYLQTVRDFYLPGFKRILGFTESR